MSGFWCAPAGTDEFEILAGHNRTAAAKLAGWTDIPTTVMAVNDQRAISIAIATNLLRWQDLTIIERGKAYKALLDARNRARFPHGFNFWANLARSIPPAESWPSSLV